MLARLYNQEFTESVFLNVNQKMECLWKMWILWKSCKMENKRYEILLSFRNANMQLLNNRYQAG